MRVSTYTRVYPIIRQNNLPDPDYALLVNGLYLSLMWSLPKSVPPSPRAEPIFQRKSLCG